jgi:hypothetical protein
MKTRSATRLCREPKRVLPRLPSPRITASALYDSAQKTAAWTDAPACLQEIGMRRHGVLGHWRGTALHTPRHRV